MKQFVEKQIDNYTLIRTEGPEVDVPHSFVDYEDVISLLQGLITLKLQQIFNYLQGKKVPTFSA